MKKERNTALWSKTYCLCCVQWFVTEDGLHKTAAAHITESVYILASLFFVVVGLVVVVVWCGVEWSGVEWCGVVWCGAVWCGAV